MLNDDDEFCSVKGSWVVERRFVDDGGTNVASAFFCRCLCRWVGDPNYIYMCGTGYECIVIHNHVSFDAKLRANVLRFIYFHYRNEYGEASILTRECLRYRRGE